MHWPLDKVSLQKVLLLKKKPKTSSNSSVAHPVHMSSPVVFGKWQWVSKLPKNIKTNSSIVVFA